MAKTSARPGSDETSLTFSYRAAGGFEWLRAKNRQPHWPTLAPSFAAAAQLSSSNGSPLKLLIKQHRYTDMPERTKQPLFCLHGSNGADATRFFFVGWFFFWFFCFVFLFWPRTLFSAFFLSRWTLENEITVHILSLIATWWTNT